MPPDVAGAVPLSGTKRPADPNQADEPPALRMKIKQLNNTIADRAKEHDKIKGQFKALQLKLLAAEKENKELRAEIKELRAVKLAAEEKAEADKKAAEEIGKQLMEGISKQHEELCWHRRLQRLREQQPLQPRPVNIIEGFTGFAPQASASSASKREMEQQQHHACAGVPVTLPSNGESPLARAPLAVYPAQITCPPTTDARWMERTAQQQQQSNPDVPRNLPSPLIPPVPSTTALQPQTPQTQPQERAVPSASDKKVYTLELKFVAEERKSQQVQFAFQFANNKQYADLRNKMRNQHGIVVKVDQAVPHAPRIWLRSETYLPVEVFNDYRTEINRLVDTLKE